MRSVAPAAAASRSMAASPRERRTCSASVMRATSAGHPGPCEAQAPGEIAQHEARARLQRMASIQQHPRDLAHQSRHRPRGDQRGRDAAGVAERAGLSRGVAVDQHDVEAEASQAMCTRRAHDARADDDGAGAVRRAVHGAPRPRRMHVDRVSERENSIRCAVRDDTRGMARRRQPRAAARASRCRSQRGWRQMLPRNSSTVWAAR